MHAPQRMQLSERRKSSLPQPSLRPLSTSTMCSSPPARGPWKCEVYVVIGWPVADARQQPQEDAPGLRRAGSASRSPCRRCAAWRQRHAQVGVAFVGADDEAAGLGDGEVHAGDARVGARGSCRAGARARPRRGSAGRIARRSVPRCS